MPEGVIIEQSVCIRAPDTTVSTLRTIRNGDLGCMTPTQLKDRFRPSEVNGFAKMDLIA